MKRKNIYITEKQEAFIKEYIKKQGGGTETDVVRQALEDFIKNQDLPFGNLIKYNDYNNFNDYLYIEISPRGTGKTGRLVNHAKQYLEKNSRNQVNIISNTHSKGIKIKKMIGEYFKNRVFVNDSTCQNLHDVKNYYDEFDHNQNLKEVDVKGYYSTSPAKVRYLTDWPEQVNSDFLLKLLMANKGKYVTYTYAHLLDKSLIEMIKSVPNDSLEYGAEWLKLNKE